MMTCSGCQSAGERKNRRTRPTPQWRKIAEQLARTGIGEKKPKKRRSNATTSRTSELSKLNAAASLAVENQPRRGAGWNTHTQWKSKTKVSMGNAKDETQEKDDQWMRDNSDHGPPAAVYVITAGTTIEPESVESQGATSGAIKQGTRTMRNYGSGKAVHQDQPHLWLVWSRAHRNKLCTIQNHVTNRAISSIESQWGNGLRFWMSQSGTNEWVYKWWRQINHHPQDLLSMDEHSNHANHPSIEGLVRALHLHIGVQLPNCSIDFPIGSATIEQVTYLEIIGRECSLHTVFWKKFQSQVWSSTQRQMPPRCHFQLM